MTPRTKNHHCTLAAEPITLRWVTWPASGIGDERSRPSTDVSCSSEDNCPHQEARQCPRRVLDLHLNQDLTHPRTEHPNSSANRPNGRPR